MPTRTYYSVLSDDLATSRDWYSTLLGYQVAFDSDWFVHLQSPSNDSVELGILARDGDLVPERFRGQATGGMLTIGVADVDAVHAQAAAAGYEIVEEPQDLFYGQRACCSQIPTVC